MAAETKPINFTRPKNLYNAINGKDVEGMKPFEFVKKYIECDGDVNANIGKYVKYSSSVELTPLMYATYKCNKQIVELLVNAGAFIDAQIKFDDGIKIGMQSYYCKSKKKLERGLIYSRCNGFSAIHFACYQLYYGNKTNRADAISCAKILVDAGANTNLENDTYITTPLFVTINSLINENVDDCIEMCKVLINGGADVHFILHQECYDGYSTLNTKIKHFMCLHFLTRSILPYCHLALRCDFTRLSKKGEITYENLTKFSSFLINKGLNINFCISDDKSILMHFAENNYSISKLLIDAGANVNYSTKDNKTALHYAIENKQDKIVEYLINSGNPPENQNGV